MHGAGNDFVLLTEQELSASGVNPSCFASAVCDRKLGVGADGVLMLSSQSRNHPKMVMYNPDGTVGSMCGNGLRCFIRYVEKHDLLQGQSLVESATRIHKFAILQDGDVQIEMGLPQLLPQAIGMIVDSKESYVQRPMKECQPFLSALLLDDLDDLASQEFRLTAVGMGNPHLVIYTRSVERIPLRRWGPAFEHHPYFPERCNVHFVEVVNPGKVKVRTWERGAGETLACGSGACAVAVAGFMSGFTGRNLEVCMPGGPLNIYYREDEQVLMSGPAEFVFEGSIAEEPVSLRASAKSSESK